MKRVSFKDGSSLIFGDVSELKPTYRAIVHAAEKGLTSIWPLFQDFPVFSGKTTVYGLLVLPDGEMTVIAPDTVLSLLMDEGLIKDAA